jgi:hypothetical protein
MKHLHECGRGHAQTITFTLVLPGTVVNASNNGWRVKLRPAPETLTTLPGCSRIITAMTVYPAVSSMTSPRTGSAGVPGGAFPPGVR